MDANRQGRHHRYNQSWLGEQSAAKPNRSGVLETANTVLARAEGNASASQIVGAEFYGDFVTGHDTDVMLAHFARDVGEDFVFVFEHAAEHGIGEGFLHGSSNLYSFFFSH